MPDPFSAFLAAIPGLAQAGAAIASASGEKERNAQLTRWRARLCATLNNVKETLNKPPQKTVTNSN